MTERVKLVWCILLPRKEIYRVLFNCWGTQNTQYPLGRDFLCCIHMLYKTLNWDPSTILRTLFVLLFSANFHHEILYSSKVAWQFTLICHPLEPRFVATINSVLRLTKNNSSSTNWIDINTKRIGFMAAWIYNRVVSAWRYPVLYEWMKSVICIVHELSWQASVLPMRLTNLNIYRWKDFVMSCTSFYWQVKQRTGILGCIMCIDHKLLYVWKLIQFV